MVVNTSPSIAEFAGLMARGTMRSRVIGSRSSRLRAGVSALAVALAAAPMAAPRVAMAAEPGQADAAFNAAVEMSRPLVFPHSELSDPPDADKSLDIADFSIHDLFRQTYDLDGSTQFRAPDGTGANGEGGRVSIGQIDTNAVTLIFNVGDQDYLDFFQNISNDFTILGTLESDSLPRTALGLHAPANGSLNLYADYDTWFSVGRDMDDSSFFGVWGNDADVDLRVQDGTVLVRDNSAVGIWDNAGSEIVIDLSNGELIVDNNATFGIYKNSGLNINLGEYYSGFGSLNIDDSDFHIFNNENVSLSVLGNGEINVEGDDSPGQFVIGSLAETQQGAVTIAVDTSGDFDVLDGSVFAIVSTDGGDFVHEEININVTTGGRIELGGHPNIFALADNGGDVNINASNSGEILFNRDYGTFLLSDNAGAVNITARNGGTILINNNNTSFQLSNNMGNVNINSSEGSKIALSGDNSNFLLWENADVNINTSYNGNILFSGNNTAFQLSNNMGGVNINASETGKIALSGENSTFLLRENADVDINSSSGSDISLNGDNSSFQLRNNSGSATIKASGGSNISLGGHNSALQLWNNAGSVAINSNSSGRIALDGDDAAFLLSDNAGDISIFVTESSQLSLGEQALFAVTGAEADGVSINVAGGSEFSLASRARLIASDSAFSVDLNDSTNVAVGERVALAFGGSVVKIDNGWRDFLNGVADGTGIGFRDAEVLVVGNDLTLNAVGGGESMTFVVTESASATSTDLPGLTIGGTLSLAGGFSTFGVFTGGGNLTIADGFRTFVGYADGDSEAAQPYLTVNGALVVGEEGGAGVWTYIRDGQVTVDSAQFGDNASLNAWRNGAFASTGTIVFGDGAELRAWNGGSISTTGDEHGITIGDNSRIVLGTDADGAGSAIGSITTDGSDADLVIGRNAAILASGQGSGLFATASDVSFGTGTEALFALGAGIQGGNVILEGGSDGPGARLTLGEYNNNAIQWAIDRLLVERGENGAEGAILDVGQNQLTLQSDGGSRFELEGGSGNTGGALATMLSVGDGGAVTVRSGDVVSAGSVIANEAVIDGDGGARLFVSDDGTGDSIRAIWRAIRDGNGRIAVATGLDNQVGDITNIDSDNLQTPDWLFYDFTTEVSEGGRSLDLVGQRVTGQQLVGGLDVSPQVAPVLTVIADHFDVWDDRVIELIRADEQALIRLGEQATATVSGVQTTVASSLLGLVRGHIGGRLGAGVLADDPDEDEDTGLSGGAVGSTGLAFSRSGAWGQTFGSWADMDDRDGIAGYGADTWGLTVGADTLFSDEFAGGLALTYATTDVDFRGERSSNSLAIDNWVGSVYGGYRPAAGSWYADVSASIGHHGFEDSRVLVDLDDRQTASYSFTSYQASLEGGADFNVTEQITMTPFGRISAAQVNTSSFAFGGALPREEHPDSISIVEPEIGVRVAGVFDMGNGAELRTRGDVSVGYNLINNESGASLYFNQADVTVAIPGTTLDRTTLRGGLGLDYNANANWTVSADYRGEYQSNYHNHTGAISLRYAF